MRRQRPALATGKARRMTKAPARRPGPCTAPTASAARYPGTSPCCPASGGKRPAHPSPPPPTRHTANTPPGIGLDRTGHCCDHTLRPPHSTGYAHTQCARSKRAGRAQTRRTNARSPLRKNTVRPVLSLPSRADHTSMRSVSTGSAWPITPANQASGAADTGAAWNAGG